MSDVEVESASPAVAVTLEDVERALYELTGWQKPQATVDETLNLVVKYAGGVRRGLAPLVRVMGHQRVATGAVAACGRAHLDEHVCAVDQFEAEAQRVADAMPYEGQAIEDAMPFQPAAVDETELVPVRRNEPAMTVEQLLAAEPGSLRPAQRVAREVLLAGEQRCTVCGEVKPLDKFYRDRAKLTQRMGKCADCSNAAATARRAVKGR
jgi:hypothetical protein